MKLRLELNIIEIRRKIIVQGEIVVRELVKRLDVRFAIIPVVERGSKSILKSKIRSENERQR